MFTPGPWNRDWVYGELRHINKNVDWDAFYSGPDDINWPDKSDANLIASAPDLYKSLKSCIEELENYLADARGFDDRNDLTNLITQAKEALAKAEGK